MTIHPGRAAQSVLRPCLRYTCDGASAPGGLTFSGRGLEFGEQVEAASKELAGDRHGGDVGAAAGGGLGVEGGERRAGLGSLGGLLEHEADPRRAHLGDVAVADLTVGVAHRRGEPGPGAQLAGSREAADVANLGDKVMAVIGPIPGRACSAWTRGSDLVRASRSRSSRATSGPMASTRARQSVTTVRCTVGRGSSASQARPAGPHNGSVTPTPRSARIACTRHLSAVAIRTSAVRWRSKPRWSRTAWGRSRPQAATRRAAAGPGYEHRPGRL